MADKRANLILELKDNASAGLGKFKAGLVAAGAAVAGFTAFMVDSLKAYAAQETAVNKLEVAMKNQGVFTKAASKDMQNFASELQKTTTFGDELILEQQALLTTFGLTGDKLKDTTKAALDLSTGLGIDLKAATLLLGKAFAGDIGTLSRYGIKIDENIPKAKQFDAVMTQLNSRFGGSAQAALNTVTGQMTNFTNRVGDLKEVIGKELLPVFDFWIDKAEALVGWLEKITAARNNELTVNELGIQKLREEREAMIAQAEQRALNHDGVVRLTEAEQQRIIMITDQIAVLQQAHDKEIQLNQSLISSAKIKADSVSNIEKKEIDARIKRAIAYAQWETQNREEGYKAYLANEENVRKEDERTSQLKKQYFTSTLNYISALSTAKNKELAAIGKAAGIAQATIDTYRAANVALASAPPPLNFALAAAVVAAGLANVARIAGVQLAEGGIVLPRAGGTLATIGEGGSSEAVIPLNDDRARDQLRDSGFGNNITINVGTLVGTDGMKEFAKMLDEELFALRRNNESVAFEAL